MKGFLRYALLSLGVIFGSVVLESPGVAIIRLDSKPDSEYLAYGANFPAVARMDVNPSINDYRSCVLINDQWILTGGHNYANPTYKLKVQIGGQEYEATNWARHPKYNVSALTNGYDFAVGQLDRRVLNVNPAILYSGQAEAGKVGSIVGFGATGNGIVGQNFNDFKKRGGTNLVEYWATYPNLMWSDFDDGTTTNNSLTAARSDASSPTPTNLECNIGNGDSGGGMFIWVAGQWQLAGISSFRTRLDNGTNSSIYGSVMAYSRVNRAYQWIIDTANAPGRVSGHVSLQDWTAPVQGQLVTVVLTNAATGAIVENKSIPLDLKGGYSFSTSYRGRANMTVSAAHWLRVKVTNLEIAASGNPSTNFSLPNGDCDGDNVVSIFDMLIVNDSFDTSIGQPGYDPRADLDGDDSVTFFDYIIVSNAFDREGQ